MKFGFKFFIFLFTGILISVSVILVAIVAPRNRVILNKTYDVVDLKKRIDNNESFIFFTGFNECPACRSFKEHTIKRRKVKKVLLKLKRKLRKKYVLIGYLGQTSENLNEFIAEIEANNVNLTTPESVPHFAFIREGREIATLSGNDEENFTARIKEVYSV